jgi:hypothetical protein
MIGYMFDAALSAQASPATGPADPRLIEQLLGSPLNEYFGFVDDASMSVTAAAAQHQVGLVATVTDEVIANQRVERLIGLVRSAGAFGNGDINVEEQQHGDVTVHVVTVSDLEVGGAPAGSISIAVSGGRLYLGNGTFVTDALDRTAPDSLAAQDDYRSALAAGGATNAGIVYADLTGLRSMIEADMSDAEKAEYAQETQPFLEPLSHLMVVTRTDGAIVVSNAFLYVE